MIDINAWATRWGIPAEALAELRTLYQHESRTTGTTSEARVQAAVRLRAAELGWRLWRNNSGVLQDANGRPVRFGLGNESKQLNDVLKSSDLIGLKPGGQFVAIECKAGDWRYRGNAHERAQAAFLALVAAHGGDGRFITDASQL